MPNNKSEDKPGKKHEIIVIKHEGEFFSEITNIINEAQKSLGYATTFISPHEYLDHLNQKKVAPPLFVICLTDTENSYKDIFKKVGEVYPETRRMLIAQSNERDLIIDSLNNDEMHFCLIHPFTDSDFSEQIKSGFDEVENGNTWEYTKRIVNEQTIKMYKIAKMLKEHDIKYEKTINHKQKQYQRLTAELGKTTNKSSGDFSLEKYMALRDIPLGSDGFKIEFEKLMGNIKKVYEEIASKNSIAFKSEGYSDIFSKKPGSKTRNEEDVAIINNFLGYIFNDTINTEGSGFSEKTESGGDQDNADKKKDAPKLEQSELNFNKVQVEDPDSIMEMLEDALEFEMDDNRLQVQIAIKDKDSEVLDVENIFEYLREIDVSYGLINEQTLLTWLESKGSVKKLIVAQGTQPELPVDGKVTYHFDTDFIHAGKVKSDGSMDFRERGDIPFVEENILLAEKIRAKQGQPGVDVSGAQIALVEPFDPIFVAGDNTFESEGGMKIYAKTGGQPHLDAMGAVSVAPVLNINSNVDFETGNISFNGSIVVNGAVKEGFKVEGTNLTVEQIEGAQINLTGDLNVNRGIIDSDINTQGNIQTKYINNTTIETFGDLLVTTEVLDSKISLSGKCDSPKARIIGSEIIAKGGVAAGQIGTIGSKPVKLRVGVDDYIAKLLRVIDKNLNETNEQIGKIKKEIEDLNKQDEEYFKTVSESAYTQDRTQLAIKDYKKKITDLESAGNAAGIQEIKNEIKKLEEKAVQAEKDVENALDNQDKIADQIPLKEKGIEKLEEKNIGFMDEKKALKELSEKSNLLARVIVNGKITAGTRVESLNSSLTVRDDTSRCRIEEIGMGSEGVVEYYEMKLLNL